MTTFLDGPAKGQTLMLHRAARFLRVTERKGKFDALDQIHDEPEPDETIYAYEMSEQLGSAHICARGGRGGFYPIVKYKLVPEQPTDEAMRTLSSWRLWCEGRARIA